MALADRGYMRDPYHPPSVTKTLIIVLIAAFLVQTALLYYGEFSLSDYLALSAVGLRGGRVYQLITFQFLHSSPWPWHVLFNCLGLYFFGRPVEEALGAKRFLWLYLLSGVAGGCLQVLLTLVLPRHPDIPVVGASAGVCGLIAIFCSMNPMQELTTWIYFFPITIRARYFLMFLALFSAFGALFPYDYVANGAHLGISYVRWRHTVSEGFGQWGVLRKFSNRSGKSRLQAWRAGSRARTDSAEFISKEIDPILDKISVHGIHSLTEREQKILEAVRKKMGER